jgi:endogenous inhibitor of DNA gyrase (YacG/DUF329 family)
LRTRVAAYRPIASETPGQTRIGASASAPSARMMSRLRYNRVDPRATPCARRLTMSTPRSVRCPTCSKPVAWVAESRWRPFCSERCKLIDLGAWANGSYRIPAVDNDDDVPDEDGDKTR